MSKYLDKWGRYHHKPCINLEPSSNNGWIYTAYGKKVGVPVDMNLISTCYSLCIANVDFKFDVRTPGKIDPPMSRDEVLGAASLGLLKPENIENWNFSPFPLPRFSALSLIKQLWEIRPKIEYGTVDGKFGYSDIIFKHRNYFWQNNLDQLYRFAFSVPVQDRYFMLKTWNSFKWYKPSHLLYLTIAKIDAKLSPSGIRFLKYSEYPFDYDNKQLVEMVKEFPTDHPIRVKTGL